MTLPINRVNDGLSVAEYQAPSIGGSAEIRWHSVRPHTTGDAGASVASPEAVGLGLQQAAVWIGEISDAWRKGAAHTLELASIMFRARKNLRRGEWAELWKNGTIPFAQRKGEMLVVVGGRLDWASPQTFARLPRGWSILYQLSRLDRTFFERLLEAGAIHPKLTLKEAKVLAARPKGSSRISRSANVQRRFRQFRLWVQRTVDSWTADERDLATSELSELVVEIEDCRGANIANFQIAVAANEMTNRG